MATKTKKTTAKNNRLNIVEDKSGKKKKISVEVMTQNTMKDSFKIAKRDYDKFYKLGMKYAREFNKMAIAKRKELVHNDDQMFGWTDGFVEGALVTMYDALDTEGYRRQYHVAWCKNP